MKTQWGCLHKTSSVYQVVGFIWCPPHPPHSPPTCTPNTIAAGALIHRSPLGRSGVQVLFITGQTQSWHMNRVFPSPNWQSRASHECYHKANESHYHLDNSNKMVCGLCIVTYLVQYSFCVCLDDKRIPKTSLQICKGYACFDPVIQTEYSPLSTAGKVMRIASMETVPGCVLCVYLFCVIVWSETVNFLLTSSFDSYMYT